jgi:hypothetical protein
MPSPHGKTNSSSLQPALELIYLATLEPVQASQNLRKLLLNNPNYFDSLTENSFRIVLNINGDTGYESLGCVRYIPLLDRAYASINIKRETGYSFQIGRQTSREYVRFYLSYNRGATWQDRGVTAVNVVDEPGERPRMYLVTRTLGLLENYAFVEDLVMVRAILSWNSPPPADAPDWTPLWGNVAETQIRVGSRDARRTRSPRAEPRTQFEDETALSADLGRCLDAADAGPVDTFTSAGRSSAVTSAREYQASAF